MSIMFALWNGSHNKDKKFKKLKIVKLNLLALLWEPNLVIVLLITALNSYESPDGLTRGDWLHELVPCIVHT